MKKRWWVLILLGMLSAQLTACTFHSQVNIVEPITTLPNEPCIETFDAFAFSTPDIDGPEQTQISPLEPWQIETSLPESAGNRSYQVSVTRQTGQGTEIWLQPYMPEVYRQPDLNDYRYLVYQTDTQTWRVIDPRIENNEVFVDQLWVNEDGSIWGRNVWAYDSNFSSIPALSYYDETTEQFIFVKDTASIPTHWTSSDYTGVTYPDWTEIVTDTKGVFWFFAHRDAIYSFNRATLAVTRHAELSDNQFVRQVVAAPDGGLYFSYIRGDDDAFQIQEFQINHFDPTTNEITVVINPQDPWPAVNSILVDSSSRLWLSVFGWQEPNGEWVQFHPQIAKFIRVNRQVDLWKYYQPPKVIMESSDGRLWFNIPRSSEWKTLKSGLAWYNPMTHEGCWFTSEGSNVVEDGNHIVWAVSNNTLYKYDLSP